MSKDQENRSFSAGFFQSLTKAFKSPTNNDRQKFDVTQITEDLSKQKLFDQLRSGSLITRAHAAEQIREVLYEFDPIAVPDVWYCASDLCSPNVQQSIRRAALKLLGSCAELQYEDASTYFIYFNDCLNNCHFTKDKVEQDLDLFIQVLQKLTNNGSFIHDYQKAFREPLVAFFINVLTPQDITKSTSLYMFLGFATTCINSKVLDNDSMEKKEENITKLLQLIIKISLKTSDRSILERCIEFIDSICLVQSIPKGVLYETLEVVCGSSTLDLHYFYLSTQVVTHLIENNDFQLIFTNILSIIDSSNSKDKNTKSSVGAIKVLSYIFPLFSFKVSLQPILETFNLVIGLNKSSLNQAILQFFTSVLQNDATLTQLDEKIYDSKDLSILTILRLISSKIESDDEIESFRSALDQLQSLAESSKYPGSLEKLILYFVESSKFLTTKNSNFVFKYYAMENLCTPAINPNWKSNTELILEAFLNDDQKDIAIRLGTIKFLKEAFESSLETSKGKEDIHLELIKHILLHLSTEESTDTVKEIANSLIELIPSITETLYDRILKLYIFPGFIAHHKDRRLSISNLNQTPPSTQSIKIYSQRTSEIVLKAFVTIFANTLITNGKKASLTYDFLIKVAENSLQKKNVNNLLIISRVLVRIRRSAGNSVYLTNPTDIEGLSAAFSRNLNVRLTNTSGSVSASLDEMWTYPEEISYIPEDSLDVPSKLVKIAADTSSLEPTINIDEWLSLIIQILETSSHWEIYSFIYAHFCPQLSNIKLFESCSESIRKFRSLICDQLSLRLPPKLKIPANITKSDLQVAIVRNFTPLISYHAIFSKQDEDQIINGLLVGLSEWDKTVIPCIHILTVCCYEIPLSIKKYLSLILATLQTRVSSVSTNPHILEFLLTVSYIPSLTSNFTVEDFKRAFGITFKLIQYSHDVGRSSADTNTSHQGILTHGKELEAEISPSTMDLEMTPTISVYLLTLSYDVIGNWFLNMKLKDRRLLSSFIIKNLILSQSNRGEDIDNYNLAFSDLISRFTYSDLELKFDPINLQNFPKDAPVLTSRWIYGNGIISIQTHAETGESIVAIRRASGSTVFRIIPDKSMVPYYTNQLHNSKEESDDVFTENYMFLQLCVHLDPEENSKKPLPIPDEPSFNRSIANFDRIPVVEFHKIGLLYVAPNQVTETEILSNTSGSKEYERFLTKFARLIELKGCKSFYVGGLDTENDSDGDHAYAWNDKILQLIFHTTTLMPNRPDDPNFSSKKRHIGNNYVNIFFDESGHNFDFNVIKSQFNFLNIVIQPHSISFPNEEEIDGKNAIKKYKVKVYRRSGVPALFATCHFKIVSEDNLATFVRTLALVSDQFAQIWHSDGAYSSSWCHRIKQIMQIKEKATKVHNDLRNAPPQEDTNRNSIGHSFLEQLSSNTGNNEKSKSPNEYEFVDADDNDNFKNLEFTSFTK